jgi:hypothetical protein
MKNLFYNLALYVLTLTICFKFYSSLIYDPCGYVGSSKDPTITDFCLSTSIDCCYIKWEFDANTYYACVSKTKLIENGQSPNITMGFIRLITNSTIRDTMIHSTWSVCNSTDGVILTPEILTNPGTLGRMLSGAESNERNLNYYEYYESYLGVLKDKISYGFKYSVSKILEFLFFV